MEETRESLRKKLAELNDNRCSFEAERATLSLKLESSSDAEEISALESNIDQLSEQINSLDLEIKKTKMLQDAFKRFNNIKCINNTKYYAKKLGIKLGELELESGNQPGYLSKKAASSGGDVTMEFVVTACEIFGISIDTLVNGNPEELSPTEAYLLEFINKLIKDTREDGITWTRETKTEVYREACDDCYNIYADHPLCDMKQGEIYYDSKFFRNSGVTIAGNCYYAPLPGTRQYIYIMYCNKGTDESITWTSDKYYEIYLKSCDGYDVKPICNTLETEESITAAINVLVKEIIAASGHVHISKSVKDVLDMYMNPIPDGISDDELPFY